MPRLRLEQVRVNSGGAGRCACLERCCRCNRPALALCLDQPSAGQPPAWICQACRCARWKRKGGESEASTL